MSISNICYFCKRTYDTKLQLNGCVFVQKLPKNIIDGKKTFICSICALDKKNTHRCLRCGEQLIETTNDNRYDHSEWKKTNPIGTRYFICSIYECNFLK